MKVLHKKRTILITAASILIVIAVIISINLLSTTESASGISNIISNPLRTMAISVAGIYESIYNSIYSYERLMAQYEEALGYIAELERNERESVALAEENQRLKTLLGFRERHAQYEDEAATVLGWNNSTWVSSFTINRGYSNSSIKVGNAVVTEEGVIIGQVSNVEATEATVKTVLDTTFSLSVYIGGTEDVATLRGDYNLMSSGLMMLDFIDDDMLIMVDDKVVTSGIGSVFPPGLVVGQINEIHQHITGIGRYATVKPIRDINPTILNVFVIVAFGDTAADVN